MALGKFRDPADPIWEQRVNQIEEGTGIGEITTAKLANEAVTAAKLSNEVPGRKTVFSTAFVIPEATETGATYLLYPNELVTEAAAVYKFGEKGPNMLTWETVGWKVGTRTPKLLVQVQYYVNATAPTSTFEFGLAQQEAVKGGAKQLEVKSKGLIAGTKITVTAPAKETTARPESATFELTAGGIYCPVVKVTTKTAASSLVSGQFFLYQEE